MTHVLMVIAPEVFRDEEYAVPKDILEDRGARVTTASTRAGTCRGKLGMTAEAELAVADANAADYDAVIFVGGGGAQVFFDDPAAHALARAAAKRDLVLAAICIAPSVLAHAGLLDGVAATAFPTQRDDLTAHGALWSVRPVEVDGLVVTANGPDAALGFGLAIGDLLGLP
ncbi:MAG: DJ-1/PfpI family protein [Coriobacteriia bacterium]|nr:DJ-1/PfpI family protein [Coriobacteriia bacterium]MBN2840537.1 DJ-1/PfpI family protein [Coriobacteriia bacterium]